MGINVPSTAWRSAAAALLAGVLFGAGLALGAMTDPDKVLNFLDPFGQWDPSLALVMLGALAVAVPGFAWLRGRGCTLVDGPLHLPTARRVDRRLLLGSALFGAGWGLAGYCPGPALANLARPTVEIGLFLAAMAAGSLLASRVDKR